jgi:hypothetical protein
MENKMANLFHGRDETTKWRLMVGAAKAAISQGGYSMTKIPGRGLSNVWNLEKGGKTRPACIRTTRDRWIAFPPLEKATKWRTLDDVELVVVATVDSKDDPKTVQVYLFPADDVRKRFDASRDSRIKAGQPPRDNFGMWVALDLDQRGVPASAGSGIIEQYKPIAEYSLQALLASSSSATLSAVGEDEPDEVQPRTVAEIMADARERVAHLLGVRPDAVKLDLKVEY